jgi:hypothetical protein
MTLNFRLQKIKVVNIAIKLWERHQQDEQVIATALALGTAVNYSPQ